MYQLGNSQKGSFCKRIRLVLAERKCHKRFPPIKFNAFVSTNQMLLFQPMKTYETALLG
jgi:hypothetical protein